MRFCFALLAIVLSGCGAKTEESAPKYFTPDPTTIGIIKGTVRFTGKVATKTIDLDQDPECVKAHGKRLAIDEKINAAANGSLANVFVYIKKGLEGKVFVPPSRTVTIDQRGCWFHPRVIGIRTGQTLRVTNSDPLTHNIHPLAQVNREWNQSQEPGSEALQRRFARQEIMVPVKCNIHGWMRAFIGVVDHPYFAVTNQEGLFEMTNVHPGQYTIAAWHESLGIKESAITLGPAEVSDVVFTFKGE